MARLIDADKLIDDFDNKGYFLPEAIEKLIAEQPTAYDVDKVIEKIKNISEIIKPIGWSSAVETSPTKGVIDIVKAGGVDEV